MEQSIHLCICICRMRWQLGCVRPSALEGGRVCLTRYITIAMVDMINVLFGTTTCLDDKGNPPFFFSFFFFFFSFLSIFGGKCVRSKFKESVGAQEKRMKGTKGTNELQMLKWKMIECEKLETLHFSVAYLGVVYLNQSYLIFFFSEKRMKFAVLYLS